MLFKKLLFIICSIFYFISPTTSSSSSFGTFQKLLAKKAWHFTPNEGTLSVLELSSGASSETTQFNIVLQIPIQESTLPLFSQFGFAIQGYLVNADPPNGCTFHPGQYGHHPQVDEPIKMILLTNKLNCSYQTKVELAQQAGFGALLIHNVGSNAREVIDDNVDEGAAHADKNGTTSKIPTIPSYFIGEDDGLLLRSYTYQNNYLIEIEIPPLFYQHLILYFVWIGITVVLLYFIFHMFKPCFDHIVHPWCVKVHRARKLAGVLRKLNSFPVVEWKLQVGQPLITGEGHEPSQQSCCSSSQVFSPSSSEVKLSLQERFEKCVICMEHFSEGDYLRVLYCSHGFHQLCIDKWLVRRQRCPICKSRLNHIPNTSRRQRRSSSSSLSHMCCCCLSCSCCDMESELSDDEDLMDTDDGFDPAFFLQPSLTITAAAPAAVGHTT